MNKLDNKAIGFIETKNFVAAIIASDSMVKAACVSLHSMHTIGGARTCVIISGDLASCQAAITTVRALEGIEKTILARPAKGIQEAITNYLSTPDPIAKYVRGATEDNTPIAGGDDQKGARRTKRKNTPETQPSKSARPQAKQASKHKAEKVEPNQPGYTPVDGFSINTRGGTILSAGRLEDKQKNKARKKPKKP